MKTTVSRVVSRREAALRQLHVAIRMLHEGQYECAVTLALAAEDSLPDTQEIHLFKALRDTAPDEVDTFNFVRNWLKHSKEDQEIEITDTDAVIALIRGTSKFTATYKDDQDEFVSFENWTRTNGFVPSSSA